MRISKWAGFWGVFVFLFLCLPFTASTQEGSGYTVVSAAELKKMQDSGGEILLIDTRPYAGYKQERIPGAKHFEFPNGNMDQWDESKTVGKSKQDYDSLLGGDKDKPVVFYCTDEK